tara:strand:- start:1654 stop:2811 length:1158 start_codon:yes stop_codon:yes gene_type:complete
MPVAMNLQQPPLSLYIHLPWCESKCPYCDFNSHPIKTVIKEEEYLQALLLDLAQDSEHLESRSIISIFIGGGTPSLFSASSVARLISGIRGMIAVDNDAEITLEANPGSSDSGRFVGYREAGVNRLSLGVQTFSDDKLLVLGRAHNSVQARLAIEAAIEAGFTNVNIDLMFGLPSQNAKEAKNDLVTALEYQPQHLSLYQLTIEPNTYFAVHKPTLPDEETDSQIRETIYKITCAAGYNRYEISAFAKPDAYCRHNRNIWQFGDYVGIGAGAHGKVTSKNSVTRYMKEKQPDKYIEKVSVGSASIYSNILSTKDLCFEFMLNALRLSEGFLISDFEKRTGVRFLVISQQIHEAVTKGLVQNENGVVKTTELGRLFLDDLVELFLP